MRRRNLSQLWKDVPFEKPQLKFSVVEKNRKEGNLYVTKVRVRSKNYSRFVYIDLPGIDVHDSSFSDNYFDLIGREVRQVVIKTRSKIDQIKAESLMDCRY